MANKVFIPKRELETFRASLPEYRRYEKYRFITIIWDVVKGFYLARGRVPFTYNVKEYADANGLMDLAGISVTRDGVTTIEQFSMHGVDLAYIPTMSAEELDRPGLFAHYRAGANLVPIMIDGHNRCFRAYQLGRETLPAYFLNEDESRAILVR